MMIRKVMHGTKTHKIIILYFEHFDTHEITFKQGESLFSGTVGKVVVSTYCKRIIGFSGEMRH